MDMIGPLIEPEFTRFQAATKGGSCGPNIATVFQHLGGGDGNTPPDDVASRPLWNSLFGSLASAIGAACTPVTSNHLPAPVTPHSALGPSPISSESQPRSAQATLSESSAATNAAQTSSPAATSPATSERMALGAPPL
eukprot:4482317-Heterocapsa_arctica.AAC.1